MCTPDNEPRPSRSSDPLPVSDPGADPIGEAERAAASLSSRAHPRGGPGPRFDRRSPFFVGMAGAAGVFTTVAAVLALRAVESVLILIGVAFFLALGLEPLVRWVTARNIPRVVAVAAVFVLSGAAIAGLVAAAVPPLTRQASQLVDAAPHYLDRLTDPSSWTGRLNERFGLQDRLTQMWDGAGSSVVGEVATAGEAVFTALTDTVIVAVLTVYFLAGLPRLRTALYRFIPHSRRPRAILLGDEIFAKVGAYVAGNILISVIAGAATFLWLTAFSVPYALLLALFVAVLDLVPVVGSTIAGIAVAAVALTVSVSVCVATWRIAHADLIGEVQTVVHCGNDLPICREIQRGAWRWATARWGKQAVTVANGKEQIEAADGSRWMVKSQDAAYGYDANLAMVDEAWDVKPDTVTEGLEPMLLERLWAQLHITSTAHRRARSLMKSKISVPLAGDDGRTLLLLWAALPQDDPGDPETWRKASPYWSESARRMIGDKYTKALAGEDDPQADDPDPMEGFRAQYLNIWTLSGVKIVKGTPIADATTWGQLVAQLPDADADAAAIESWFDGGCSLALAWRLPDGGAAVRVLPFADLAAAVTALDVLGYRGATIVGKSMLKDPALKGRKTTAAAGAAIGAVLDLSRLLAEGQFAHDATEHLTDQVLAVRTVPGADGPRLASQGRVDALKAATWAATAARARTRTKPRILVARA